MAKQKDKIASPSYQKKANLKRILGTFGQKLEIFPPDVQHFALKKNTREIKPFCQERYIFYRWLYLNTRTSEFTELHRFIDIKEPKKIKKIFDNQIKDIKYDIQNLLSKEDKEEWINRLEGILTNLKKVEIPQYIYEEIDAFNLKPYIYQ